MKDKLQYLKQKNGFSANRVLTVCLSGLLAKKLTALLLACLLCVCAFGCSAAPEDEPAHSPSLQDPELNKTDDTDNDVNLTGPGNDVSHGGTASGSDPSQDAGNVPSTGTSSSSDSESSGHDSVQNPNQNENPGNNVVPDTPTQPDVTEESCAYCGKTGHQGASCPKKAADEAPCTYCNQTGHKISSCPKKAEDEAPCSYCGKTGHKLESCPTRAADEAPCTYCNKTGHKEASCPKKVEDEAFDINYWVQYAKDYAVSIGMVLDEGVSGSWDNPLSAFVGHKFLEKNIKESIDYYKTAGSYYYGDNVTCYLWVWAEEVESGKYNLYMGYGYKPAPCTYCNEIGHKEANCPKKAEDEAFDINYWVQYAKDYAVNIGMILDQGVSSSWDNPLAAFAGHKFLEKNIKDRIDYYKTAGSYYYGDNVTCYLWVWAEEVESGKYSLYMGYGYDSVTCAYCNETGHNEANCPRRQNKLPEN